MALTSWSRIRTKKKKFLFFYCLMELNYKTYITRSLGQLGQFTMLALTTEDHLSFFFFNFLFHFISLKYFLSIHIWYCHTPVQLGLSAQVRILQVPACKMEPQHYYQETSHPPTWHPSAAHFFCAFVRLFFLTQNQAQLWVWHFQPRLFDCYTRRD